MEVAVDVDVAVVVVVGIVGVVKRKVVVVPAR